MTHKPPQGIDAPNCAHKLLKKQMVGEQLWYVCECDQKFRVEPWDGKVSVLAPPAPRKDLAALEEAIERLPWWSLVTADEAVRHTVGFMGDGTYIRREKVLELIAQASRGTDLAAPVPVIVGKMRDFANECLRRYQLNPSYCAEIMHTEDAYRDILKLCELAEMRGAKR